MRLPGRSCLLSLVLMAAAVLPLQSMAAVRVELKNGRTIVADQCRESDGSLRCYKMGGTFTIEKKDIVSIKKTSESENPEEETSPSEPVQVKKGAAKADKGGEPGNPAEEARKRLDEINARKRELLPEREKLVKERENLRGEVKEAPDWMTVDKFEDLKKRISSLDEKIKSFNDEARKLNEEEKTILDSLKKEEPKTPLKP